MHRKVINNDEKGNENFSHENLLVARKLNLPKYARRRGINELVSFLFFTTTSENCGMLGE